ncbi:MAG: hypothetical protein COB02_04655 [Candidatus Cloacimonadota bacterium]|nr:MAG: hypothetical protein COB02_04655 [Candidatus Cloacimonadota bacterium]
MGEIFKILLVDDDEDIHQSIPALFTKKELSFDHSYSFKDSVVKLATVKYDLIICDFDLGVKSGIDLAIILRKYRPNTNIFMLVANYEYSTVLPLAKKENITSCYEKPYIEDSLIDGILSIFNENIETSIELSKVETKIVSSEILEIKAPLDDTEVSTLKKFNRPSSFKTLDGEKVILQEVPDDISSNLSQDKNELSVEDSATFLKDLVIEVDSLHEIKSSEIEDFAKVQKVQILSIQEEELALEKRKEAEEKKKKLEKEETKKDEKPIVVEEEKSDFGFSSSTKKEKGLEIDFDGLDESRIHEAQIDSNIKSNPFEYKFAKEKPKNEPHLRVVIAQNILSAALVCYPLDEDHHSMDDVRRELENKNVNYNVDFELLETLIEKVNLLRQPILGEVIATGKAAIDGKNGYIKLSFTNTLDVELLETDDGKVDFKNIYKIDCVRKNDILGEIIPPTPSINGMGVTSFVLKGKTGKARPILPGKGVAFDKKSQKFYSELDGQPFLKGNKILVSKVYVVPNGVDYSTGNISFVGSVHICGDVASGFEVEAEGDILVEGIVEGAILKAGGSIKIQKGFAGADKGSIYAEGDVRCKYISNGNVEAMGEVLVEDSIINSAVTSHSKIKVFNKKGNILGGLIRAKESIRVLNLGSDFGVATKVIVGKHFILKEQLGEINKSQKLNSLKMDKISKGIQSFTSLTTGKTLDKNHLIKLKQLKSILQKLKKDEGEFELSKEELLKIFNEKCRAKIFVKENAYSGVSVQIGNTVYALNDIFSNCSFFEDRFRAVVKLGKYEEE